MREKQKRVNINEKYDKNAEFFFILEPDVHITFLDRGSVNSK